MKCSVCKFYSRSLLRCTLGKVNPPSLRKTREVAQLMGYSYICDKNDFKETSLTNKGDTTMKKTKKAVVQTSKPDLKTAENTAKAVLYFDKLISERKPLSLLYKGKEIQFREDYNSSSGFSLYGESEDTLYALLDKLTREKAASEDRAAICNKLLATSPLSGDFNWAEKQLNKCLPKLTLNELATTAKTLLSSLLNCQVEYKSETYDYSTSEYKITLSLVLDNKYLPFIWQQKRLHTEDVCTGLTISLNTIKHEFCIKPEIVNSIGRKNLSAKIGSVEQLITYCNTFEATLKYIFFTQSNEPSISHVYCTHLTWLAFLGKDFKHMIAVQKLSYTTIWSDKDYTTVLSWKCEFEKQRKNNEELYSK